MKKIISVMLIFISIIITLSCLSESILCIRAQAETIEERLVNELSTSYQRAKNLSGMSSFNGYCGACTGYQLQAVGLFNSYIGFNGNDAYNTLKNRTPDNGASVTLFPGAYKDGDYTIEQICNIINKSNEDGHQTYTVFGFHTGSSSSDGQAYGHVLLVHAIYNGNVYWCESFGSATRVASISSFASTYATSGNVFKFDGAIAYNLFKGEELVTGYSRVLPDGDYAIISVGNAASILAITGGEFPAQNGANVQIYNVSNPDNFDVASWDAWTINYNNQFYQIHQKDSNMNLNVHYATVFQGENVNVSVDNGSSAQRWAISCNGYKGYRLQAKCSGFSLDVEGGNIVSGSNVDQHSYDSGSNAQHWVFIPYRPSQQIPAGRYILVSALDDSYELDVAGDTGDIENGRNVQIWSDNSTSFYEQALSQYNSFDVVPLDNGYYKLVHVASGKELTVLGGTIENKKNIGVNEVTGHSAHEWAITPDGFGGGYILRAKCSGLTMEAADGVVANGTNVFQRWYNGTKAQTWSFVPAEYTIAFDANGGSGAPTEQIKYYKGKLVLSSTTPIRDNYTFLGWATNSNAEIAEYLPGDTYSIDANVTFYAVWQEEQYTVTYNANTSDIVSNMPSDQKKTYGTPLELSDSIPTRSLHTFIGWSTDENSDTFQYLPGDIYSDDEAVVLYAIWQKQNYLDLPNDLIEIGEEAFEGCGASIVVVPYGCEEIGVRAFADCENLTDIYIPSSVITISRSAFAGCTSRLIIHGTPGSVSESFAVASGFEFVAYEP